MASSGQEDIRELVRYNQPGAIQAFAQDNPDTTIILNGSGGTIIVPSDYDLTGGRRVIFNRNGGTIQYQDVSATCEFCGIRFQNQTLLANHNWKSFKKCSVHGMCFDNWTLHNKEYGHTICSVQSCSSRGGPSFTPAGGTFSIGSQNTSLIVTQKREGSVVDSASPAIGNMVIAMTSMSLTARARHDQMEAHKHNQLLNGTSVSSTGW